MSAENEPRGAEPVPDPLPMGDYSPVAWVWGRSFLIGAVLFLVVFESLVVWLVPDAWCIVVEPLAVVPVFGFAQRMNARRRRAK